MTAHSQNEGSRMQWTLMVQAEKFQQEMQGRKKEFKYLKDQKLQRNKSEENFQK